MIDGSRPADRSSARGAASRPSHPPRTHHDDFPDQPQSPHQLSGHHQRTYDAVLRHPTAHNLEWHDLRSMLGALAEVSEGNNGSIQAKRNGQVVILHPPNHKADATVEDVLAVRRFLTEWAELAPAEQVAPVRVARWSTYSPT